MSRLTPYFGFVLALFVGAFIVIFSNKLALIPTPTPPEYASSTISVLSNTILPSPPLSLHASQASTTGVASTSVSGTSPRKRSIKTPEKVTKFTSSATVAPLVQQSSEVPTPPPSSGNVSLDATALALRGALVNIMCYAPLGSGMHSISGSGVFIDSKGIILTNAHVAQYFLLADRDVSCTIRAGSPAATAYTAALIYIPSAWIHANAAVLTQTAPIGTGEYDFALLAVTQSATTSALPTSFPFVPLADAPPPSGTPVVIASFGAQFLALTQIQSGLFPTIVFGSVKNVFTFATNTVDVLALGGSAAAQEGSSGGGVANAEGLVGTITTSTVQGPTDARSLSAITASYIRFEYSRETGSTLDSLLSLPTSVSVTDFAPKIPALESIVTAQLP